MGVQVILKTRLGRLRDRARMFAISRSFFSERGVLEVDCPILSSGAAIDTHIDLITALYARKEVCYLHSSPEYGMKRLLSEGSGDIYQLSHVFRDEELSSKHNPEFTMVEWYRLGMSFVSMIAETLDFIRLFLGDLPHEIITYKEAFHRYAGINYLVMTDDQLIGYLRSRGIEVDSATASEGRDALLNVILGTTIESHLGQEGLCALAYYPSTQAALAQTQWHGEEHVAERFEIYYHGMELANGYHELADAKEQRDRLISANKERMQLGKEPLPLDEDFLQALEGGVPDCSGVAVGFDRLMMLRHGTDEINDILSLPFSPVRSRK